MFQKILIANRGEIARRIIRSSKALGYTTVAVYSEADRFAPFVSEADEAICIGPAASAQSYLSIDRIIAAIDQSGAQAVHPGYGFLSENALFARALERREITFIGPPVAAIEAMGQKREAKARMIEAGVPCVPGYHGEAQGDDALVRAASEIGYPIMVKASAGGGGRGMRLVEREEELLAAVESARSEAESAFGSGVLLLERAVIDPRHVEIQVFADTFGATVHLGERDCSIQRRHQKVIEEAPSPALTEEVRERMGEAAVAAAQAIGYVGAGTVEFLLDANGSFYFLEMNTRLQVEHPVTEMITGQDLVAWQLEVANGQPLPLTQDEISLKGHAIEARLYAEDPAGGFLPQTGDAHLWIPASGEGVRVDDALTTGTEITPHYDPMIAKVIAHGPTREVARRRLVRALSQTVILGATTNRAFLVDCLNHPRFIDGEATTSFIARAFEGGPEAPTPSAHSVSLCATLLAARRGGHQVGAARMWSSTGRTTSLMRLDFGGGDDPVEVRLDCLGPGRYVANLADGESVSVVIVEEDEHHARVEIDGLQRDVHALLVGEQLFVQDGAFDWVVEDAIRRPSRSAAGADGKVLAPMSGKVLAVEVEEGQQVQLGDRLGVLEAMKMEHNLTAPIAGRVKVVGCEAGEQVSTRALLFQIEAPE